MVGLDHQWWESIFLSDVSNVALDPMLFSLFSTFLSGLSEGTQKEQTNGL